MPSCRTRPRGTDCPHPVKHGTIGTYNNHRCRCGECRVAWANYTRDLRARRRGRLERGEIEVQHGNPSTYQNWGCRCASCGVAHSKFLRERAASV